MLVGDARGSLYGSRAAYRMLVYDMRSRPHVVAFFLKIVEQIYSVLSLGRGLAVAMRAICSTWTP